jgi:hypothetical protein
MEHTANIDVSVESISGDRVVDKTERFIIFGASAATRNVQVLAKQSHSATSKPVKPENL